MRTRALLAVAMLMAALPAAPASGHDHVPPEPVLRAGKVEQDGILVTSCWIRGKELGGAAVCRQVETTFPEPEVTARRAASIDLGSGEPKRVRLRAWRRLKPSGRPRAPARRPAVTLEQAGGVWLAGFTLPRRPGTWYLEAKAVWPDRDFPESEQFALWTFALRTS